jgi:methylase of polypeptide subunit release factors
MADANIMDAKGLALIALGRELRARGYRFVAVTPATHRRVVGRLPGPANLRSVFGWNRPFRPGDVDPDLVELLAAAGALQESDHGLRSGVRFATVGELLFAHSSFPTTEPDAVFFGPDSYRFVRLLRSALAGVPAATPCRLVDIGCGSGVGGLFAAKLLNAADIVLADINRTALAFSAVNAVINDFPGAKPVLSDVLDGVDGHANVIIANPPYLVDDGRRLYRHGGGARGIELAVRIAKAGLARLAPGGCLVLYTGTPIVAGADPFFESVKPLVQLPGLQFVYEEIDPDVFGEELDRQAYADVDRIAVVGLTAIKD